MTRKTLIAVTFALMIAAPLTAQTRERVARRVRRPAPPATVIEINDDFRNGALGWEAGFADYSPASTGMDLDAGIRPLPPELEIDGTGFMITGNNHSDDLFSFLAKKLTVADGVRPNRRYSISFRILLASNASKVCGGIGGAPGLSVYLKTGGTGRHPVVALDDDNHYRINIDIGAQSNGGTEMSVAGNVANDANECSGNAPYLTIERIHTHPVPISSSTGGDLWLLVGTDSGFEGRQTLYYESIEATLTPLP